MKIVTRAVTVVVALATATTVTACAPFGLSGSSTCSDFLKASADAQYDVVSTLAADHHKLDYATPLGRPNIPYFCSQAPNMTLDALFDKISS